MSSRTSRYTVSSAAAIGDAVSSAASTAVSFTTLTQLSAALPGTPSQSRLSEVGRGTGKFPQRHEVIALAQVCTPARGAELLGLLAAAEAERSALAAAPGLALEDVAVTGTVAQFRNWDALGVHRPITRLSSGDEHAAAYLLTKLLAARGGPAAGRPRR